MNGENNKIENQSQLEQLPNDMPLNEIGNKADSLNSESSPSEDNNTANQELPKEAKDVEQITDIKVTDASEDAEAAELPEALDSIDLEQEMDSQAPCLDSEQSQSDTVDIPEEGQESKEAVTEAKMEEPSEVTIEETADEAIEETDAEVSVSEPHTEQDTAESTKNSKSSKKPNPIISFLFETLEMVAISIGIVILLITFVVRYSPVSGESMTYTINEGDSLLVQIAFYTPEKNDIVILQAPDYDLNKPLIKRVIATEGDSLEINFNTWEVKVNGVALEESYVRHNPFEYNPSGDEIPGDTPMSHQDIYNIPEGTFDAETNTFKATVPEGTIFVMGDNRNNSHDSRSSNVGFVDVRCVVGKAIYRIYPFANAGKLD